MNGSALVEVPSELQAIALRPYQVEALAAIEDAAQRGQRRQLIVLPTGTGKTVIFCELIRRRPGRVLVLVHRNELIDQTIEKLALIAPDLAVGVVKAERDEHTAPVVIASVQTVSREARLQRIAADFDVIIVDEAHHATADSYGRVLAHLGEIDGPLVLGFTATPYRGDGDSLLQVFPEIVYQRPLLEMIRAGYLSDLRALRVQLAVDFNDLHTRAGDFIDRECADLLRAGNAAELVAAAYREHAPGRRGLVFVPTVELAEDFAAASSACGISAETVNGETPLPVRRDLLRRFRAGDVQVIVNCAVLTEGYDEPSVDCIVVARPTKSKTLYVQMLGRGTRRYPGKPDCLVLDVAGATERHDLMTLANVFELPAARLRNGASVAETTADYERECDALRTQEADAARVVASRVDLFQARPLNWVVVGAAHFVLAVGLKGMVHVHPSGAGWRASLHHPDGRRERIADMLDMNLRSARRRISPDGSASIRS
jgi:superfamily II DNA or RNA helicase